ncbi:MAG: hypothetical protein JNL73_03570 [Anaerolineales bacterium]|nr:hypothetical protein [Anaerolineales bacterium]
MQIIKPNLVQVQLSNKLRAVEQQLLRELQADVAQARALGDADLGAVQRLYGDRLDRRLAAERRHINRYRLDEYKLDGLSLDRRGLNPWHASVPADEHAFAQLCRQPGTNRFQAWAKTHTPPSMS